MHSLKVRPRVHRLYGIPFFPFGDFPDKFWLPTSNLSKHSAHPTPTFVFYLRNDTVGLQLCYVLPENESILGPKSQGIWNDKEYLPLLVPQFSGPYGLLSLRGVGTCLSWLPVFPLLFARGLPGDWSGREGKTRQNQKQGTL